MNTSPEQMRELEAKIDKEFCLMDDHIEYMTKTNHPELMKWARIKAIFRFERSNQERRKYEGD